MRKLLLESGCAYISGLKIFRIHLPCVWLWDYWVGLDPTRILGTESTHPLFGCTSDFEDEMNQFHVWLKELGIRVGWHDTHR